jgi:hypothetical protein
MLTLSDQDRFALKATERHIAAAIGALPRCPGLTPMDDLRDRLRADLSDVGEILAGDSFDAGDDPAQARRSLVEVLEHVRDNPEGLTPRDSAALRGAILPALVRAAGHTHAEEPDRLSRLDAELRAATHPKAEGEGDDRFHSVNPAVRPMGDGWYEPEFGAARSSERGRP